MSLQFVVNTGKNFWWIEGKRKLSTKIELENARVCWRGNDGVSC